MIANIFFSKTINENNQEIYSETFVYYYLTSIISNTISNTLNILIDKLLKKYGNINVSQANKFINKHFALNKGQYLLNNDQETAYFKTKKIKQDLFYLEWESYQHIYKSISEYVTSQPINFEKGLSCIIALLKKSKSLSLEVCQSIYFDYILNYNKYYLEVDKVMNMIDDSYNKLPLNIVISNPIILEILFANEINTIKDLKSLSSDSLLMIFSIDYENVILSLSSLNESFISIYKEKINDIFNNLKPRELDIICLRNGLNGQPSLTLEEVGKKYEITRERCRQIEAKALNEIKNNSFKVKSILINLYLFLCSKETRYFSEEILFEFVSDSKLYKCILFLYEVLDLDIKYSRDLKVIYNTNLTSLEDICDETLNSFGEVINFEDYNSLNSFEKSIVNYSYKIYKNKLYVKRGIGPKELICMTIDDLFPEGYRIGEGFSDYYILKENFDLKYGISDEFPSSRSISGFLERMNYCQIDKGTYRNRKYCIALPQDLVEEIINFILTNQPLVFYRTIFEKFKAKLMELGIENYYYLKGTIDIHLPKDFMTKRNYIRIGTVEISGIESIVNYIKTFNGAFTLGDLKMKFAGVKDYTFLNVFYNECEKNLIALGNQKYIYVDRVLITEDTINDFKKFIDDTFKFMGTKVISSRKIYARMSLLNSDLLERLKIASDSFSTFSLINHFFRDEYGFHRPLISLDKNDVVSSYVLILNYVSTLDSFNMKTLKNYIAKMNIGGLNSYLEFMEEQSENFVQVNMDTMVAKEKIAISESSLKEIEKMLDLIFNRFNEIDTRKFNGYAMLPKLTYLWNKYLLAGIVRSYFSENYEVKNTETTYDSTDFIIRRIK